MELELGLALPRSHAPSKVVLGFDLNGDDARATAAAVHRKKRGFTDAFGSDVDGARVTLPLFVWASAPRDDDNNAGDNNSEGGYAVKADPNCGGGGCAAPVGWPPVKSAWRNAGATRYVKVKMEGVAIGRKVDLSLHRSYATLLDAVDRLFTRNHGEEGPVASPLVPPPASRRHRTFTYQVGNGDWMLLGDVPWETFVKSVKRLKILSCGE